MSKRSTKKKGSKKDKKSNEKKKSAKKKPLNLKLGKKKSAKKKDTEAKKKKAKKASEKKASTRKGKAKKETAPNKKEKKKAAAPPAVDARVQEMHAPKATSVEDKPVDHSSNYKVREAVRKLRSLGSYEEVLAFTKGEQRVTVTRAILVKQRALAAL